MAAVENSLDAAPATSLVIFGLRMKSDALGNVRSDEALSGKYVVRLSSYSLTSLSHIAFAGNEIMCFDVSEYQKLFALVYIPSAG